MLGQQHLIALALSVFIIIYFPLYAKNHLSKGHQEITAKILALFLIAHELAKPFYRTYFFGDELVKAIPLYACNLSAFLIAIYVFTRKKIFLKLLIIGV